LIDGGTRLSLTRWLLMRLLPPNFDALRLDDYWPSAIDIVFGEADPPCATTFLSPDAI